MCFSLPAECQGEKRTLNTDKTNKLNQTSLDLAGQDTIQLHVNLHKNTSSKDAVIFHVQLGGLHYLLISLRADEDKDSLTITCLRDTNNINTTHKKSNKFDAVTRSFILQV